jgi:hypothetical protein
VNFLALVVVSLTYGWLAGSVFRHIDSRATVNRIVAHLLSFRLFIDEPRLVLRAQAELIRENLRLLRLIALPCLLMALMFGGVAWYFGKGPIPAGQVLVASLPADSALPAGLVAETPGVHVARLGRVYWRVRTTRPLDSGVEATYPTARFIGMPWWVWFFGLSVITTLIPIRLIPITPRARVIP